MHATPPESEDVQMILGFCKHTTPLEPEDEQMIHGFCKHTTPLEAKNQKDICVFYRHTTPLEPEDICCSSRMNSFDSRINFLNIRLLFTAAHQQNGNFMTPEESNVYSTEDATKKLRLRRRRISSAFHPQTVSNRPEIIMPYILLDCRSR